jgi:hypothetical protein
MFSKKYFNFLLLGTYVLNIYLYNLDLDYMIPKGISQNSIPNPKYIYFRKENNKFKRPS